MLDKHLDRYRKGRRTLTDRCAHYDVQLESVRASGFDLPNGVFLVGNYVGGIGVTMLLEQAAAVATRVSEMA